MNSTLEIHDSAAIAISPPKNDELRTAAFEKTLQHLSVTWPQVRMCDECKAVRVDSDGTGVCDPCKRVIVNRMMHDKEHETVLAQIRQIVILVIIGIAAIVGIWTTGVR